MCVSSSIELCRILFRNKIEWMYNKPTHYHFYLFLSFFDMSVFLWNARLILHLNTMCLIYIEYIEREQIYVHRNTIKNGMNMEMWRKVGFLSKKVTLSNQHHIHFIIIHGVNELFVNGVSRHMKHVCICFWNIMLRTLADIYKRERLIKFSSNGWKCSRVRFGGEFDACECAFHSIHCIYLIRVHIQWKRERRKEKKQRAHTSH